MLHLSESDPEEPAPKRRRLSPSRPLLPTTASPRPSSTVDSVTQSSGEEELAPQKPAPKKRSKRLSLHERREKATSVATLEKLVLKACRRNCGLKCFQKFKQRSMFEKLVKTRNDWAGIHKLDQDQAVTWIAV